MSLLLAPYNNAMRLGQGFNTFTQQICVDNAVVGISDGDDSQPLRPVTYVPVIGDVPPAVVSDPTKKTVAELEPKNDSLIMQYPSQIVTYSSKYVSKLSDVSNDLNISGSLSIRYGEISGGGSGSYVNTDTFQQSDINFLIQVTVVNQTLNIKDQLIFWPVGNRAPVDYTARSFTDTYGDAFISGFQEGGVFSAIVSIRALNSGETEKIAANAHIALQIGVGSVTADADVQLAKKVLNESSEVTITVNWSGGGQLKEGNEKWTIDTLQDVAVRFADLVAACPQRTHAVLTKYTALRGYLQWKNTIQLDPLDYEVANLYTAELLDVYMGYKAIWKEIHVMLEQLDLGLIELVKAPPPTTKIMTPKTPPAVQGQPPGEGEQLFPFDPDFEGLDTALQTCRSLMVRIVAENDAITKDPALAIDATRPVAYLRSQIFRTLLPQPPAPPKLEAVLAVNTIDFGDLRADLDPTTEAAGDSNYALTYSVPPLVIPAMSKIDFQRSSTRQVVYLRATAKSDILTVNIKISDQEKFGMRSYECVVPTLLVPINDQGVQAGTWTMPWRAAATQSTPPKFTQVRQTIQFPYPYDASPVPQVVAFLSGWDFNNQGPVNICVSVEKIGITGFDVVATALDSLRTFTVSWFACPTNMAGIACGSTSAPWASAPELSLVTSPTSNLYSGHVQFPGKPFLKTPAVFSGLRGYAMPDTAANVRIATSTVDVTPRGFNWKSESWADTTPTGVALSWIAWNS